MIQTSQQTMFVISLPSLLALGFIVAIVLIIMGLREMTDLGRKRMLLRTGTILLGLMVIFVPISWYGYLASLSGSILVTLADIVIIASLCSLGGIIAGIGTRIGVMSNQN